MPAVICCYCNDTDVMQHISEYWMGRRNLCSILWPLSASWLPQVLRPSTQCMFHCLLYIRWMTIDQWNVLTVLTRFLHCCIEYVQCCVNAIAVIIIVGPSSTRSCIRSQRILVSDVSPASKHSSAHLAWCWRLHWPREAGPRHWICTSAACCRCATCSIPQAGDITFTVRDLLCFHYIVLLVLLLESYRSCVLNMALPYNKLWDF